MSKVYRTQGSGVADAPVYVIRNGRFYRTVNHPAGWSDTPVYEICSDGKVYALPDDQNDGSRAPAYEFREMMLYRTAAHPDGAGDGADYYIFD